MEYLNLIISFVVGGGLSTLVNFKISNRKQKLDFADTAMEYMENFNAKLIKRIESLENEVKWLSELKCEKYPCKNRIPPSPMEIKQTE